MWFYIIADTFDKMKQVSTGPRRDVIYKLYYYYVDIPASCWQIFIKFGVNSTWI